MQVCLFEPEIAQNAGSIARLCACYGSEFSIIEPAAFLLDEKNFRRAGMDYVDKKSIKLHSSFADFRSAHNGRVILLDTKAEITYCKVQYEPTDCIMAGKESSGVPNEIFNACDTQVKIPMLDGMRAINVAMSVAVCLSEAMRQLNWR
ncbi:MAG: tRNA (cytidine(34)-2'-O)-methyltransferase [Holosporales bacterium]|jgi:tRNA (cytidine/uridine-2'-O-)-methyltransferase|nr:tRNA (cytidine(34)-2'-O)-methyltransferase [Holosporales bacterium]